ncbi:transcriptional regulator [Bacillus atrophaeus]|uniref:transcriptional regulator n=1 Tax=Bacillus atrophaeus TaxID=1452 RepID=UPI000D03BDFD|nr:transcriptional regulator [Bacillus atrophaeus]MED4843930.1 transcriptional regulator [Bacillus atrophaeus]PRS02337.1 transcriptional regulator [Bacillus atrophaeus]
MANSPYNIANLQVLMRKARKECGFNQFEMGQHLGGRDQRYVSNVEKGFTPLTPELCIRWFEICKAYEHIDLVHYVFKLHPMAAAPIDPALNESAHAAIINMVHEMEDASKATKELAVWLNNTRPGKETELPMHAIKQIFDLTQANKTLMYSLAREFDLKISDLADQWSRKAIVSEVAMHKNQKRQAVLV